MERSVCCSNGLERLLKLKMKKSNAQRRSRWSKTFKIEKMQTALKIIKLGKTVGIDGIYL